jgi:hypothetical protein
MNRSRRKVVVLLHAGRRAETLLGWLRQMLPAAILLATPAALPALPSAPEDALVVDAQDIDSPLSLADAIARAQERVALDQGAGPTQG